MRFSQRLLDPTAAEAGAMPTNVRDLAVAAQNVAVLAFDNVSQVTAELSDALCRLATGSAFTARGLYTDGELRVFHTRRPVILNDITDFATRPDLLDRAVILRHTPFPPGGLRSESELDRAFAAVHPRLLGAMFTRVAGGLRTGPAAGVAPDVRMVDFARFGVACEAGAGEPATFLEAYTANRADGQAAALDDSPIAAAVVAFMDGRDEHVSTMADLLKALAPTDPPREWPRTPAQLSNRLARLAPALAAVHGIRFERTREKRGSIAKLTRTAAETDRHPAAGHRHPASPAPVIKPGKTASGDAGDDGDATSRTSGGRLWKSGDGLPD